jgi:hypothetical protein
MLIQKKMRINKNVKELGFWYNHTFQNKLTPLQKVAHQQIIQNSNEKSFKIEINILKLQ